MSLSGARFTFVDKIHNPQETIIEVIAVLY